VTPQQQIAKLEGLLEQVRARAAAPRPVRVAAAPVADEAHAVAAEMHAVVVEPAAVPAAHAGAPAAQEPAQATVPPDYEAESAREAEARLARDGEAVAAAAAAAAEVSLEDAELEVLAEPIIAVARHEPAPAHVEPHESRERLVAAEPLPAPEEPAPPALELEPEPAALAQAEEMPDSAVEDVVEQPPSSSRRPVAPQPEERIADIAFGASEEAAAPRHTPPPESGKLPAAPVVEFDPDVTGVREAPAIPRAEPAPIEETSPAAPVAMKAKLEPEVTRAELAASNAVAEIVGEAQRFHPSTMADLVDASLGL
jgi:hypothetical protein